jgi:DNA-binding NtrC family response regulator
MRLDATIAKSRKIEVRGGKLTIPNATGPARSFDVDSDPITVGRHASCAIVLDDPLVSAVHAELVATTDGVRLRDRGSSNGTFLAGARVVEAYLVDACRLQLGDTRIEFAPSAPTRITLETVQGIGRIAGSSAAMQRVFHLITRAAPTELTVLLLGETGTGKELAARAIHDASARKNGPFVVVDCGAIPPSLAEAHLFGHEAGAFTGAVEKRVSPFVEASGGTLFLDELGELPLELQPKLLRAIAERRIKPVGGSKWRDVDVRLVAATQRDLPRAVNEGAFRSDLWFRVAQLVIELPALRERLEDIPAIIRRVLEEIGDPGAYDRVSTETLERVMRRGWPGNVRELRSAIVVAHALSEGGSIDIAAYGGDGAKEARITTTAGEGYHDAKKRALEAFERDYFAALSTATDGKIVDMARIAGLERAHVRKYLRRHGLRGGRSE